MNNFVPKKLSFIACCVVFLCVAIQGQPSDSYMGSGNDMMRNGSYASAISMFRKVLYQDPGNFEAQFNIAISYLYWSKYSDAIAEFNKALRINPRSADAWGNLGVAYEQSGKTKQALDALYRAVQLAPDNPDMQMNLATTYMNLNMIDNAIAQFKEVIKMDGNRADAYLNLGNCLVNKKKPAEALEYLKFAAQLDQQNADVHWQLGNIYWKTQNNFDEAIVEYTTAIDLKPNDANYYENLGLLYEEIKKPEEALKTFKSYQLMLNDAFEKERIQKKIDKLQRYLLGDTTIQIQEANPEKDRQFKENQAEKVSQLRDEVRKGESNSYSTQRVKTSDFDVMLDLENLSATSTEQYDPKKELEKRKAKKALEAKK